MDFQVKLAETVDEIKFLFETRTNPEVNKMLSNEPPKSFESHKRYIEKVQNKSKFIYIGYAENTMVGYFQIGPVTENEVEVGYAVHPKYQGKGFGKQLVNLSILVTSKKFTDKKIILYVKESNKKAIDIYKKYNFEEKESVQGIIKMELIN